MLKYIRYYCDRVRKRNKSLVDLPEDYEEKIQNIKFLLNCLEGELNYLNQSLEKFPSGYRTRLRHCRKSIDAGSAFFKGVSFQELPLLLKNISARDEKVILHGIGKVSKIG